MTVPAQLLQELEELQIAFRTDVVLAKRTWWRVGGPADVFATATTLDQLAGVMAATHAHAVAVHPMGNGSNLLVSDAGVRGVVLQLGGDLALCEPRDGLLHVGGGLKLVVLLNRAQRHGWGGLHALAGIPGTIGGSVRMNAGTSLGEIADLITDLDLVHADGTVQTVPIAALKPRYRHTDLPPGSLVARARLRLSADVEHSLAELTAFLERRKATQPLDQPSCGSTFTNPAGDHAGRLIEAAGLKGHRIGGAEVSVTHANFLLNTGDATATDLDALIRHVQDVVERRFGVRMRPEVQRMGEWPDQSPST